MIHFDLTIEIKGEIKIMKKLLSMLVCYKCYQIENLENIFKKIWQHLLCCQ